MFTGEVLMASCAFVCMPVVVLIGHLAAELSFLLLQLSQTQTQLGAALQLLLPQRMGVLGVMGQHALLLHLRVEG